jgi:hypothetical protein
MGYMHIENLYKYPEFLDPKKQVYAMEKIHGTSAYLDYCDKQTLTQHKKMIECKVSGPGKYRLLLNSGGEKLGAFSALFDQKFLTDKLYEICLEKQWFGIRVHGEAYGGKQQKMAHTYGPNLKFIVFDILVNGQYFLNVPEAETLTHRLGLEFVHYTEGPCDKVWLDGEMKENSIQAIRNSVGPGKKREGIVIRPLIEAVDSEGHRIIYKHKNAEFSETSTQRVLGEKVIVLKDVFQIIDEWLTDERMKHVADRVLRDRDNKLIVGKDTGTFINLMVEDIKREGVGEMEWSPELEKEIKKRTGILFQKTYFSKKEHKSSTLSGE